MIKFLRAHRILLSVLVILGIGTGVYFSTRDTTPTWTTDTVSQGTVRNIVSVSGVIDAVSTAELAFPVAGTLESVAIKEGDMVSLGQVLATLSHNDLKAEYQDAEAAVQIAIADRGELVSGIRTEERNISETTVQIATEDLIRTIKEQNDRVENARRTLFSSDLEARPLRSDNGDTAPIITGTYTCAEGTYILDIYASSAKSGYSYRLSGLESGGYTAYTETSAPLGTCGLMIQFIDGESYGNATWSIAIPNKQGASYVTNLNAYTLALTQRNNAIREAEQKLTLAKQNDTLDTSAPRAEALARAEARVLQAEAKRNVVGAQITDHILMAPFTGTVTNIEPVAGEAVSVTPIITLVSKDAFALTALIPEIDVTRVTIGQKADVVLDARENEKLSATVTFISPLAKEIDGVSYFEAKLMLDTTVDWLRSGLNGDIDVIIDIHENVTRIPKRYLTETDGNYTVLVPSGNEAVPTPITVTFMGNDGFVEITGLDVGTTVIAP